jgi:NAD(P)-dependent dehydrogenase (short-subunit alcohol dehydrogenase family)
MKLFNLSNKVVLITGGNSGIGKETAYLFAKEKSNLIITYYSDKKLAYGVASKCKLLGAKEVLLIKLDITKDREIKSCVKKVVSKFKKVDILINNAGAIIWKKLINQNYNEIESQLRTNLEGLIKMTRESLPYTKDSIINIASRAGKIPHATLSVYCASKFGVRGFTQTLAIENPKLRIYSINPDPTATRMTGYIGRSPKEVAQVIINTAMKKYNLKSGSDVDVWKVLK